MNNNSVPKIIIRTTNWLVDLIISTGFIKAVLEKYPLSEVDIIVKSGFERLPLPHRGKIKIFDPKNTTAGSFGKKLRDGNYNIFYILPPSFSSAWMSFVSNVPKRIGYSGNFRGLLLSDAKSFKKKKRSEHILKEYLNLIDSDIHIENNLPCLKTTKNWIENHLNSFHNKLPKSFIVFSPGGIYGPAKRWPVKNFRKLALKIKEVFNISILVLGTNQEKKYGTEIAQDYEWVENFCGKTSLTELIAILAKARLLVGNDSGLMHLMGALQRPQIAIFGSTSPKWTSPNNPKAIILTKNLSCSPCFARTCKYNHYECLTKITPELVIQAAKNFLIEKNNLY